MENFVLLKLVLMLIFLLFIIALLFYYIAMVLSIFRNAPYVGTRRAVARGAMKLANVKENEKVVDLGSGTGNLLFVAAEEGALATGYELSFVLNFLARLRQKLFYPKFKIEIIRKNFFQAYLKDADVVVCYLLSETMGKLCDKFEKELQPCTRIVSISFKIPNWEPIKSIRIKNHDLYLYEIGKT